MEMAVYDKINIIYGNVCFEHLVKGAGAGIQQDFHVTGINQNARR
jgi:hypothetical protein